MRLPFRVEVQERREKVPDANGAVAHSWAVVDSRAANIEPVSSGERLSATAVQGTVSYRVTMRAGGRSVKPKDRIVFGNRVFEVDGVVVDFRRPGRQVATVVEVV